MNKAVPLLVAALIFLEGGCSRSANYYLDKGDKLYATGAYADAILNYRKAIQKDPAFGQALYKLGLAELRLGKTPDAYATLTRAADMLPDREDVKVALADFALAAYLSDRRRPAVLYKKVDILADQLLAKNPKSYDGLRFKAHLAAADQNFIKAEEFYGKANDAKPAQPEVTLGWTEVMLQDGHAQQGENFALQFIQKNKTYLPIYDLMYRYYVQFGRYADAENMLKSKGANNPKEAGAILELAAFYFARSRNDDFKATLDRLLNDPKDFPQAHLAVGDLYLRLQRWDDALQHYNAGAQADPKDKVLYLKRIADVWLAQGKGEQADHVVDEILAAQPDDEAAKAVRASLLMTKPTADNLSKAATIFQGLVDKSPDNAVWRFNLGRALAAKGEADAARTQLQESLKRRRDFVPPRMLLAELSQAKGDYRAALQYTTEALNLGSRNTGMRLLHAISLMKTGDAAQGRAELRELERQFPQDVAVQLELGAVDIAEDRLPVAEQRFRKLAADRKGDMRVVQGLVKTLIAENHIDSAVSFLQEEAKKSPSSGQLRVLLASTEMQAGKYDLALAEYQRLVTENPNAPQAYLSLGNVYRQKGDFANATGAYRKAEALAPKDPAPLALLGESLASSGQKAEALNAYRRALQLRPDDPNLMNATAYLITETGGSLDEALKLAQKAVATDTQQPNFSDTLGWIYFKKNLNDSAVQVFRTITTKNPENATFHYHFGMALLKQGDKRKAESELKAALSKKPAGDVRQQIETALAKIG